MMFRQGLLLLAAAMLLVNFGLEVGQYTVLEDVVLESNDSHNATLRRRSEDAGTILISRPQQHQDGNLLIASEARNIEEHVEEAPADQEEPVIEIDTAANPEISRGKESEERAPETQTAAASPNSNATKSLPKKEQKAYKKLSKKENEKFQKRVQTEQTNQTQEDAGAGAGANDNEAETTITSPQEASLSEPLAQPSETTQEETVNQETEAVVEVQNDGKTPVTNTSSSSSSINRSWRPTEEWINACAADIATNKTGTIHRYFTKRDGYGLGDCIKMCARCTLGNINRKDKNLARQYQARACPMYHRNYQSGGNLQVVEELLENYKNKYNPAEPPKDAVVLHLRVGDVIDRTQQSTEKLLMKGGDPFHTAEFKNSIKSVHEYLDNIEESGATKVIVVGGVFQRKFFKRSRVYEGCLKRAFTEAGYDVTFIMDSGEADQDFYYMTRSSKFVVSSGGFSSLIAKLAVRNGGVVVGRTFDDPEGVAKYERKIARKQKLKK